ncbi:hypothetical protein K6W25_17080, partial [Burkholderia dolosa]|nr:hypothetical protein [Burkholderia dolosa]
MDNTKQPFRAAGRCNRAAVLAAAALACFCSYAVAQDSTVVVPVVAATVDDASSTNPIPAAQHTAPDDVDAVMMLAENASACVGNQASCAVRVYAGGGRSGGNGAGIGTTGSGGGGGNTGGGTPGGGGNTGNGAVGPAGIGGTSGAPSGGTDGTGRGGNASGSGGSGGGSSGGGSSGGGSSGGGSSG